MKNPNQIKELDLNLSSFKEGAEKYIVVADYLHKEFKILTDLMTGEMYLFREGIYIPNAKKYLELMVSIIDPIFSKHAAEEILYKIRQSETFEESPFNKASVWKLQNNLLNLDNMESEIEYIESLGVDYLITRKLPITFDKEANCPNIDKFLKQVTCGDENMEKYLLEILADCLTNHYESQKGHIFIGTGANGKGTFQRLIKKFMGVANTSELGFQQLFETSFLIHQLRFSSVNLVGDMNTKYITDSGLIKKMLGQDAISAEIKRVQYPISFTNKAKMIVAGQVAPKTNEDSDAWWRRWIISNWNFNADKEEKLVEKNLHTGKELSGLLNRVLVAYKRLFKNGFKFKYEENLSMKDKRNIYLKYSNIVKLFVEECLTVDSGHDMDLEKFYENFEIYRLALESPIITNRKLWKDLREIVPTAMKTTNKPQKIRGLMMNEEFHHKYK